MKAAMLFKSEGYDEVFHMARRKGIGLLNDSHLVMRALCEKMWQSIADLNFEELEADIQRSARVVPQDRTFRKRLLSSISQERHTPRKKNGLRSTRSRVREDIRSRIFQRAGSSF